MPSRSGREAHRAAEGPGRKRRAGGGHERAERASRRPDGCKLGFAAGMPRKTGHGWRSGPEGAAPPLARGPERLRAALRAASVARTKRSRPPDPGAASGAAAKRAEAGGGRKGGRGGEAASGPKKAQAHREGDRPGRAQPGRARGEGAARPRAEIGGEPRGSRGGPGRGRGGPGERSGGRPERRPGRDWCGGATEGGCKGLGSKRGGRR